MFTGIIQEIGTMTERKQTGGSIQFTINAGRSAPLLRVNDSVAVNGVCQTVIQGSETAFKVEAVEETLRKTTLGDLGVGRDVNLELPVRVDQMLGGHLVQGHVDDVGVVMQVTPQQSSILITVEIPSRLMAYIIPVGSIAIDGVSLTVARIDNATIVVSLIPHTLANTTLGALRPGSRVNVEVDLIGKYVQRLLTYDREKSPLSEERLREWGY